MRPAASLRRYSTANWRRACNILPRVASIFRWKGKTEESDEWMLWIKTTQAAFEDVRDTIKELHSYELPECLCLAIEDGSQEYLDWVRGSVEEFGGEHLK